MIVELDFGISLKFLFPFLFSITSIINIVYSFPRILSTFIDGSIQVNDVPSSISRTYDQVMTIDGPSGNRTHDHLVKSQMLYRTELRAPGGNGLKKYKNVD